MSGFLEMDYDDWYEEFQPIINTMNDGEDVIFETYGEELEAVRFCLIFFPDHVWTECDGDGGMFISDGYHYVNRINYLITTKPKLPNIDYEIN